MHGRRDKMQQMLLICNVNLHSHAGDITLMERRAECLQRHQMETVFLTIVNKTNEETYERDHIINTNVRNRNETILNYIKEHKPDILCFYGNKTLLLMPKIRKFVATMEAYSPKFMIDMQGALEEDIDFVKGTKKLRAYPGYLAKRLLYRHCLNQCDAIFSVSEEMYQYACRLSGNHKLDNYKFRCGVTTVIDTQTKVRARKKVREEWGIDETKIVLCFTGYLSKWQNMNRTLEVCDLLNRCSQDFFFAFFCNSDKEFLRVLQQRFPKKNYVVSFLSKETYVETLCACDIGLLLREDAMTNYVAFPNKCSDYINAGLLCYISSCLREPVRLLEEEALPYLPEQISVEELVTIAKERSKNLEGYYERAEAFCTRRLLFDTQFEEHKVGRLLEREGENEKKNRICD